MPMTRISALAAVAAIALACGTTRHAAAALITPNASNSYPQIASGIHGSVNYDYDSTSGLGVLHIDNVPYVLGVGPSLTEKLPITPTVGFQFQQLDVTLDSNGNLVNSGTNQFLVMGTTTVNGTTYQNVLLSGQVTALGSQDLDALGVYGTSFFDAAIKVTGGSLASQFGPNLYLTLRAEPSTFNGRFDQKFSAEMVQSTLLGAPSPVPEPTAVAVILLGGAGYLWMRRRNERRA